MKKMLAAVALCAVCAAPALWADDGGMLDVKASKILDISLDWLAYGKEKAAPAVYHQNPDRQRIEYLLSIIREAEYPLVIVAMEKIIEIRLKNDPENG
jgi:hypothetical protein